MVDGRGGLFLSRSVPPPFVIYKYKYINIYPSRSFHPPVMDICFNFYLPTHCWSSAHQGQQGLSLD